MNSTGVENDEVTVCYLSYTGLLEPLGRSQVLAYLVRLAEDYRIELVTFEKSEDLKNESQVASMSAYCNEVGIRWRPMRYHQRFRLPATAWDMLRLFAVGLRAGRRADILHARSYIPAFVALAIKAISGKRVIFDMRAFWPDEMVTAGRLRENSLLYRLLKWAEYQALRRADAIVTLTEAAAGHLRSDPSLAASKLLVVPTCADLDRFSPRQQRAGALQSEERLVIGCCGTVDSGWFRVDWLVSFFRALRRARPEAILRVVTRDDPDVVLEEARRQGADTSGIEIVSRPFEAMPAEIRQFDGAAMFFAAEFSELGRSPTRLAELLGCGVPCVANPGVGDVVMILERYRVGVLATSDNDTAMDRTVREFFALLEDADTPRRCRHAAEELFSLDSGVARYDALYRRLIGPAEAI